MYKKTFIFIFILLGTAPLFGQVSRSNTSFSKSTRDLQNLLQLHPKNRLEVKLEKFCSFDEDDYEYLWTYNGWDIANQERVRVKNIEKKFLQIIDESKDVIVASFFLFDNLLSKNPSQATITEDITNALIKKKNENPNMRIALTLDPLNRAYSRRVPALVKKLIQNGVDIFFTDLLHTPSANPDRVLKALKFSGKLISGLTGGLADSAINEIASAINICIPFTDFCAPSLDGHKPDFEIILEGILFKGNHRKIIVADSKSGRWQGIVASANPHKASNNSTNSAIAFKGDLAKAVYSSLREDMGHSILTEVSAPLYINTSKYHRKLFWPSDETEKKYKNILRPWGQKSLKRFFTKKFPPENLSKLGRNKAAPFCASYYSENQVKKEIIKQLEQAKPDDIIRIIMFYLSDPDIVKALLKVAGQPGRIDNIKLLLDPNKDAFNTVKDGTPNRQVAHHLTKNTKGISIRWYATHGEQNHAKAMSITNVRTGKNILFTGSANWTGKNLNGANMESNILLENSAKNSKVYNDVYDKIWYNLEPGILYSWDYSVYDLENTAPRIIGYKQVVKKMDNEQILNWKKNNFTFFNSYLQYTLSLSNNSSLPNQLINSFTGNEYENWSQGVLTKNKSTLAMAMSYFYGKPIYDKMSSQEKNKWKKKYMKKWTRGEKFGYVAW